MKIDKITNEIAKTREKITDLQTKLRDLERQKTEQENNEIVELIRGVDVTPRELAAFIEAYRQQGAQAALDAATGLQAGPEQEPEPVDEPEIPEDDE